MTNHATYVQVPPQSTGKKVATEERTIIEYDTLTGVFVSGDVVTGADSSATGTISSNVTHDFPINEGRLYLEKASGVWNDDENILVSAAPQAVTNLTTHPQEDVAMQHVVIADPNDPTHQQKIDRFGAGVATFSGGAPVFSPFGAMMTGQAQVIKDYRFAYDGQNHLFTDETSNGGSIVYENTPGVMVFSCPTTSGATAERTSDFYHPYVPGIGTLVEMTTQCGDTGKANVTRQWGLFDGDDGVFFELAGTQLSVVIRSSTTGDSSIVESRTAQADWNQDPLDGTGSIGFTLDVSKGNIFFIDFSWLGIGRVNFGIFSETGDRIIAHTHQSANLANLPYMRTGTLPICVRQINTGTSGSTSEFRFNCSTVKHTDLVNIVGNKHSDVSNDIAVSDGSGELPIISLRPKLTFGASDRTNRVLTRIESFCIVTDGGAVPLVIRIQHGEYGGLLTDASWAIHSGLSSTETDKSATAITGGHAIRTYAIGKSDRNRINIEKNITVHEFELYLKADGTTQPEYVFTAQAIGTGTTNVSIMINWEEIIL